MSETNFSYKPKKKFYMECHLAGRQYYDIDEVWDELRVGMILHLNRDYDNRFDGNAVAVTYSRIDEYYTGRTFLLGYLPADENEDIASFLEMGWGHIFECRISKIITDSHYEHQIRLTIKIKKNEEERD